VNNCGEFAISNDRHLVDDKLSAIIEERSKRILEKFGRVAVSHVKDLRLLKALKDVKNYWKDYSRPALTSFSCEAVGGDVEMAENAGVMFALASSGFGLHDDILDRSSHKHLRMTILGLHGTDIALLVGDLLIVKAWATAHEMISKACSPTKFANIIGAYESLSVEICEAEFMETLCKRKVDTDLEYYKNILWKAMAETEACSRIGAMLGDGSANEVQALSEFGRKIGYMSRLADDMEDCLNVKGDLLHRIKYESVPLPLLYAAKTSTAEYQKIKKIVEKKRFTPADAKSMLKSCFETEAFEYLRQIAEKNKGEAVNKLCTLRTSTARDVLRLMIDWSYARVVSLCV